LTSARRSRRFPLAAARRRRRAAGQSVACAGREGRVGRPGRAAAGRRGPQHVGCGRRFLAICCVAVSRAPGAGRPRSAVASAGGLV